MSREGGVIYEQGQVICQHICEVHKAVASCCLRTGLFVACVVQDYIVHIVFFCI